MGEEKITAKAVKQRQLDSEIVAQATELELTMRTQGWKKIVQPVLDKMIQDSLGYKREDGTWSEGATEKSPMSLQELSAYRKALMDFNNSLHQYFKSANAAKERLESKPPEPKEVVPMKDTSYDVKSDAPTFNEAYSGGLTSG